VQKFVDSTRGIPSLDVEGVHDLRIVVLDGEPLVSYVRQPKSGLISNVSRGGSMENVELTDLPGEVLDIVEEVDEELEDYSDRLYSVDFIFDEDENPWILELNSKPGLGFYDDKRIASWKKPLMDRVAKKLVQMG
jgi:glutathione synthase/RimK-type ligase-like ATP-grasp enzyme